MRRMGVSGLDDLSKKLNLLLWYRTTGACLAEGAFTLVTGMTVDETGTMAAK